MKNIENDDSAGMTAKLLAIPPAWEEKGQDEIARLAKEHLGIAWVDGYTRLVVAHPTRDDGAGMALCPEKLDEEAIAKVEGAIGRSLSCNEAALISERYEVTLAGTPLEVGVTGSLLFPGIPQDVSALEIIAFVQVRANGRGDDLEWYVDFSARLTGVGANHGRKGGEVMDKCFSYPRNIALMMPIGICLAWPIKYVLGHQIAGIVAFTMIVAMLAVGWHPALSKWITTHWRIAVTASILAYVAGFLSVVLFLRRAFFV